MSQKLVDLPQNVVPINEHAKSYHVALQAAHNDLYLIFCEDLWPGPEVLTREALEAFIARFKGKLCFLVSVIDPVMAAHLVESILVAEDILEIASHKDQK